MTKYYRNIVDIHCNDNVVPVSIEAGSLFKLVGTQLILVDEDVYISVPFSEFLFAFAFEAEEE